MSNRYRLRRAHLLTWLTRRQLGGPTYVECGRPVYSWTLHALAAAQDSSPQAHTVQVGRWTPGPAPNASRDRNSRLGCRKRWLAGHQGRSLVSHPHLMNTATFAGNPPYSIPPDAPARRLAVLCPRISDNSGLRLPGLCYVMEPGAVRGSRCRRRRPSWRVWRGRVAAHREVVCWLRRRKCLRPG